MHAQRTSTDSAQTARTTFDACGVGQLAAVNLRLPGGRRVDARFADQLAAMAAARDEGLTAGWA
jgi:hypothetical protein